MKQKEKHGWKTYFILAIIIILLFILFIIARNIECNDCATLHTLHIYSDRGSYWEKTNETISPSGKLKILGTLNESELTITRKPKYYYHGTEIPEEDLIKLCNLMDN
jgi:hypothetical protein